MANAPTATAATPANAGGSNKSTPAPKVGVPVDVKKWLRLVMIAIAVIISIVLIASVWREHKIESRKDADSDHSRATELSLKIEPNSDSSHVLTKSGYAVDYKGSGFILYCVYTDGHNGMNDGHINTCGDGPMLYQYLHDTSGKENTVPYEYVRKN